MSRERSDAGSLAFPPGSPSIFTKRSVGEATAGCGAEGGERDGTRLEETAAGRRSTSAWLRCGAGRERCSDTPCSAETAGKGAESCRKRGATGLRGDGDRHGGGCPGWGPVPSPRTSAATRARAGNRSVGGGTACLFLQGLFQAVQGDKQIIWP